MADPEASLARTPPLAAAVAGDPHGAREEEPWLAAKITQRERAIRVLEQRLAQATRENAAVRRQAAAQANELAAHDRRWRQSVSSLQAEVAALRASASWRITAPLRWLHARTVAQFPSIRQWPAAALIRLARYPLLTRRVRLVLARFPRLANRLQVVAANYQRATERPAAPPRPLPTASPAAPLLSRGARLVYDQLTSIRPR